jgi:acetyl-CoA carboxylase carboxyltransferase component
VTWEPELKEIRDRRENALAMGGPERVARHHSHGKQTIRERIAKLVDPGSFVEYGQLQGGLAGDDGPFVPSAYVMGLAKIDGREVVVGGEDFTVRGGSEGGDGGETKDSKVTRLAAAHRVPAVFLRDGAGANIGNVKPGARVHAPIFDGREVIDLLSMVPVVTGIMGSIAGAPAGFAMMSHWTCMVKGTSHMFAAGPPVVRQSLGLAVDKEQLGGSHVHTHISGAVDNEAVSEEDCLQQIKRVLSYLPSNVWSGPPYKAPNDRPDRREEELLSIVPRESRRGYDMHRLVQLVVDDGEFFEIQPFWASALIVGLARLNGHVVGILANNPLVKAGGMDHESSEKQVHFMEFCDQFHIPIVYFVDVPGLMVGPDAEAHAVIRKGMRAFWVTHSLTVPLLNVFVRRCYGFGGALTSRGPLSTVKLAWPSAEFGAIPIEGGVDASFKRVIEEAPDPDAKRREIIAGLEWVKSPYPIAESGGVDDLIDPRETRPRLIRGLEALLPALDHTRGIRCRPGVRP